MGWAHQWRPANRCWQKCCEIYRTCLRMSAGHCRVKATQECVLLFGEHDSPITQFKDRLPGLVYKINLEIWPIKCSQFDLVLLVLLSKYSALYPSMKSRVGKGSLYGCKVHPLFSVLTGQVMWQTWHIVLQHRCLVWQIRLTQSIKQAKQWYLCHNQKSLACNIIIPDTGYSSSGSTMCTTFSRYINRAKAVIAREAARASFFSMCSIFMISEITWLLRSSILHPSRDKINTSYVPFSQIAINNS